jgi:hypothetical protein
MKRTAGKWMLLATAGGLLAAAGGCMQMGKTGTFGGAPPSVAGCPMGACAAQNPQVVSNAVGPWGQPVMVTDGSDAKPQTEKDHAKTSLASHVWPGGIQRASYETPDGDAPGHAVAGPGAGGYPGGPVPPPGYAPGGPGPGGYPGGPVAAPGLVIPPNAVAAVGALTGGAGAPFTTQRSEIRFVAPAGMKVSWYAPGAGGKGGFAPESLSVPGRYNFVQGAIYRLKINGIPGNVNDYYPTLEVVPTTVKTAAFLAHSTVPVTFTQDDFDQVDAGNLLVKVIYLPDREFQDLAVTGPYEVVSTRLEPGVDPIAEACRKGSILAIVRLGNINLEAAGTPGMDAPSPYAPPPPHPGPRGVPPGPFPPGPPAGPASQSSMSPMTPAELASQPGTPTTMKKRGWLSSMWSSGN